MEHLINTLRSITRDLMHVLDPRVFIALMRGLWEHISDDLYIFVENLQETDDHQVI